jgi:UDP-N-acetylmuramate dehydrogenase
MVKKSCGRYTFASNYINTKIKIFMNIEQNIPLKDKNWFRTGGPARYYSQPKSTEDFQTSLLFAHKKQLPIFFLGQGANILIADSGFDGLVVHPQNKTILVNPDKKQITAAAGASIQDVIDIALDNNLVGLEVFSGIPGSVGGTTYMNIHFFDALLHQFFSHATVIHKETGTIETVNAAWFDFGYDYSKLHAKEYFLIDATFKLKEGSKEEVEKAKGQCNETRAKRAHRYPIERTCGCFFQNFTEEDLRQNKKATTKSVAFYFEQLGFRGKLSVGDAIVSEQHSNMILNRNNATSKEILTLSKMMGEKIYEAYGLLPKSECQLVGF